MEVSNIINAIDIIGEIAHNKIRDYFHSTDSQNIENIAAFLSGTFSIDITIDRDIIKGYDHDWSNMRGNADALCRPNNNIECAIIMRVCYLLNIPMTISAGRTNLTGSATPEGGIIISIAKMKDIGVINFKNNEIECSPGAYLEDLRNHVINESNNKLIFSVDPTSRKEAMVGGAISCNASGFVPGVKGAMRYWVNGLEFLLPNGEMIKINRGQYISKNGEFIIDSVNNMQSIIKVPTYKRINLKNASGPFSSIDGIMDFVDLIVGSEGIFGFISRATLKLQDRPSDYLNLFIKLKNENEAFQLYIDFSNHFSGDMSYLSGFEYFGENCSSYMVHSEYLFDKEYNVGVYIQIPVYNENMDDIIEKWYEILMSFEYINDDEQLLSLNDLRNWKTFFEARHSIPANALQKAKEYKTASIITDTIVPPSSFNEFIKKTHKLIINKNIDYLLFGHLGDCHLHFHLIPDQKNEAIAIDCYHKIIGLSSDLGGVYSAEHGTGKRKKQDFIDCYGASAVKQIRICKKGFDPNFLLNTGNVIDK